MEKPADLMGVRELRRAIKGLAMELGKRQGSMSKESIARAMSLIDILSDLVTEGYEAFDVIKENGKRRSKRRRRKKMPGLID